MKKTLLLSLLVVSALTGAQTPKVQMLLIAGEGTNDLPDAVHRFDVRTGRYLGGFGQTVLLRPQALAIQPSTGVAYVADLMAIRRFNVSTGAMLGTYPGTFTKAGPVKAMRFAPNGDLILVCATGSSAYRVQRMDPASGTVIAASPITSAAFNTKISVGFLPGSAVEVFNDFGGRTFADTFAANLTAVAHPFSDGVRSAAYRTSNGFFLTAEAISSAAKTEIRSGKGTYSLGGLISTISAPFTSLMFAEGALNQTYLLEAFEKETFVETIDTTQSAFVGTQFRLPLFFHGKLNDMAVYSKF